MAWVRPRRVAFLPDGNLVVGSMAGPLRIVDPADGSEVTASSRRR